MKLIVGLGNPGEKYESTRHNLGFIVLDHLLKDVQTLNNNSWEEKSKLKSEVYTFEWKPKIGDLEKIILAKPNTFMNQSGLAVSSLSRFYKVKPKDIWIVYDELDLPLGTMKIRFGGGTAGHHGLDSILRSLRTDKFWRFRMGIGMAKNKDEVAKHKFRNTANFVLDSFDKHESGKLKLLIKRGVKSLNEALENDIQSAMNRFNTK